MSFYTDTNIKRQHKNKAFEWLRLVSVAGVTQTLVTGLGLISGWLVVRYLDTTQLALYGMANNILGTMVILADGGITNGVMAFGSKVHEDKHKLGQVLNTGLDLRKKFAIVSLVISSPLLIYLLMKNGSGMVASIVVLVAIIPTFMSSLSGNLLEIVSKIKQDIIPLQRVRMEYNLARLALIFVVIVFFPYAYLALLAAGLPQMYNSWKLRKINAQYVDYSALPDKKKSSLASLLWPSRYKSKHLIKETESLSGVENEAQENYREKILRVVVRVMPGAAYYSFSSQINLYLISIFSDNGTKAIAEITGLATIGMVMNIISQLFATIIMPRFAKLPDVKSLLMSRFFQILALLSLISLMVIGTFKLLDTFLLNLIGDKFVGLEYPLLLSIIGSSLLMVGGNVYSLFVNRGWNLAPYFLIPLNLVIIISAILLFDVGTVEGILYMNIYINAINLVVNSSYLIYKINSKRR